MKTHLEFRSPAFPPYPGEEDLINPDLFGKLDEILARAAEEPEREVKQTAKLTGRDTRLEVSPQLRAASERRRGAGLVAEVPVAFATR